MRAQVRRRLWRSREDSGNALIEFTWLAVLLMVPVGYLVVSVFQVQRAAFGVTQATREAGRAYVAAGGDNPEDAALAAARLALQDQGLQLDPDDLTISCSEDPCLTAGAIVSIRIDTRVGLPFVPHIFGTVPASIAVHGRHDEVVDCFRSGVAAPVDAGVCP
ncbi:MAG: hypothetical protein QOK42_1923 [Frankiaceae bacterium]|nr:hypothetical protein [Frankiaceae bacterium]